MHTEVQATVKNSIYNFLNDILYFALRNAFGYLPTPQLSVGLSSQYTIDNIIDIALQNYVQGKMYEVK